MQGFEFGVIEFDMPVSVADWTAVGECVSNEKEFLGGYISVMPIEESNIATINRYGESIRKAVAVRDAFYTVLREREGW